MTGFSTIDIKAQFLLRRQRDSNPRTGITRSTPLAGAPLQPLEYVSNGPKWT